MADRGPPEHIVQNWQAAAAKHRPYRILLPMMSLLWLGWGIAGVIQGLDSGRWVLYWPMAAAGVMFGYVSYRVWRPKGSAD